MLAMAEADGEVAVRDPNQVISEIARRSLDRVREQVARPEVQLIGGAVALVTAAAVAYSLWRRRR
jgi:hypothetical protein